MHGITMIYTPLPPIGRYKQTYAEKQQQQQQHQWRQYR